MRCPVCGFENQSAMRFCGGCGYALTARCPACRAANSLTRRFCGACGADLRELERRLEDLAARDEEQAREQWVEDELAFLKDQWEAGYVIHTCPGCQTRNRIPRTRRHDTGRCGRCRAPLPAVLHG